MDLLLNLLVEQLIDKIDYALTPAPSAQVEVMTVPKPAPTPMLEVTPAPKE